MAAAVLADVTSAPAAIPPSFVLAVESTLASDLFDTSAVAKSTALFVANAP